MPPSIHGPQWDRDEEFRQSVIRRALLLGFSAEEYTEFVTAHSHNNRWQFMFNDTRRHGYASLYSAAYDYLRLMKVPPEVIGDYRG